MIVDTSALVSILLEETGSEEIALKLANSDSNRIGTPTLVELGVVASKRTNKDPSGAIAYLVGAFGIQEVAFEHEHWIAAVDAHQRFGKGRHPARLNLGDCMTYAVAKVENEPLLFVGDDFSQTDLKVA